MAKKIIFGDFVFSTKKSASDEARSRINKYSRGDILNEDDEIFFLSLFELHENALGKFGVGVSHLSIDLDFHNHRCIYIHRIDNTKEDISWVKCIYPATIKTIVSMAFRRAIKEAVIEFKNQKLETVLSCPILNVPLNYKNSHVSYVGISFDNLLIKFLTANHMDYESVNVYIESPGSEDNDQRGIIKNPQLVNDWVRFHGSYAEFSLISETANLRGLGKRCS